jgi:hypothetical protein
MVAGAPGDSRGRMPGDWLMPPAPVRSMPDMAWASRIPG